MIVRSVQMVDPASLKPKAEPPPIPKQALLAAWESLGCPEITISTGAMVYDLGKDLDGWVNPSDMEIIKLALIQ
jgi:hypothetical protein